MMLNTLDTTQASKLFGLHIDLQYILKMPKVYTFLDSKQIAKEFV